MGEKTPTESREKNDSSSKAAHLVTPSAQFMSTSSRSSTLPLPPPINVIPFKGDGRHRRIVTEGESKRKMKKENTPRLFRMILTFHMPFVP